jgi:hypothetical protein
MASEIKVDTVSEKTSGSGVTIDGLLIKDGGISGDVSLIGTTPTFTIGDAGAEDAALVFDGNAQDFYIGLDDSADDLIIGQGSTVGTNPAISIDENQNVTIADGSIDFNIASHDTSNGLKLGGTLVSATAAELNILDGVTSTAAELNILDGVTSTAAELNYSDLATLGTTAASKVFTADANGLTTVSGAVLCTEDTLTDQATIAWDVIASPVAKVTLAGNRTIAAPSGTSPAAGQFVALTVIQDGTGSRTLTWNAVYEFKDDTAPTLTTTAAKGDLFVFKYNGSKWLEVGRNQNLTLS